MSEHTAEIDAGRVTLTERERAAYGMRASAVTGDALVFMESDVERILTEREAAAWDAGWCAAVSRFTQRQLQPTLNPYRQTRVTPPAEQQEPQA